MGDNILCFMLAFSWVGSCYIGLKVFKKMLSKLIKILKERRKTH